MLALVAQSRKYKLNAKKKCYRALLKNMQEIFKVLVGLYPSFLMRKIPKNGGHISLAIAMTLNILHE